MYPDVYFYLLCIKLGRVNAREYLRLLQVLEFMYCIFLLRICITYICYIYIYIYMLYIYIFLSYI